MRITQVVTYCVSLKKKNKKQTTKTHQKSTPQTPITLKAIFYSHVKLHFHLELEYSFSVSNPETNNLWDSYIK